MEGVWEEKRLRSKTNKEPRGSRLYFVYPCKQKSGVGQTNRAVGMKGVNHASRVANRRDDRLSSAFLRR